MGNYWDSADSGHTLTHMNTHTTKNLHSSHRSTDRHTDEPTPNAAELTLRPGRIALAHTAHGSYRSTNISLDGKAAPEVEFVSLVELKPQQTWPRSIYDLEQTLSNKKKKKRKENLWKYKVQFQRAFIHWELRTHIIKLTCQVISKQPDLKNTVWLVQAIAA